MTEEAKPKVETVPIDTDGRYIIIASGLVQGQARDLSRLLHEWWEGNDKMCVIALAPGVEVRFERVEEGSDD